MSMPTPTNQLTRPCRFCGEQILAVALKCRFCGEYLDGRAREPGSPGSAEGTFSPFVILGLVVIVAIVIGMASVSLTGSKASSTFHMVGETINNPARERIAGDGFTFSAPSPEWTLEDERQRNGSLKVTARSHRLICELRVGAGDGANLRRLALQYATRYLNDQYQLERSEETTFRGDRALRSSWLGSDGRQRRRVQSLLIAHNGLIYQVVVSGPANYFSYDSHQFEACCQALRIVD